MIEVPHQEPNSHERPSSADNFSRMWRQGVLSLGMISVVNQPVDVRQVAEASRGLAERVREICILDVRQHRATRDDWVMCSDAVIRRVTPKETWERLLPYFSVKNGRDVSRFLEENPFLVNVLLDVRTKFDEYFGADSRSVLEVFVDPEEDQSSPKLFALTLAAPSSDKVSASLDRLDQEWWLDQPYEIRRLMNIDVEYVDGSV